MNAVTAVSHALRRVECVAISRECHCTLSGAALGPNHRPSASCPARLPYRVRKVDAEKRAAFQDFPSILRMPRCVSLERKALAQRYRSRREGLPVLALCAGRRAVRALSQSVINSGAECGRSAMRRSSSVARRAKKL
ncbi:hypothetical protein [Burkholderia pyrrocinia]|uniref:hypothetical protein n=1 Tax=Burkholderia pyrrocinia TaxID=60550 RepID=UPI00158A32B5|nr:hypothetical protein [Burkholderia pyrrocinia]